ncbi:hypothetical protein [Nostoc sp.]|uniref:hypothetical protein n=1 Tax=Nostoc sp. TaxID=1180 RepID=UPI002FF58C98
MLKIEPNYQSLQDWIIYLLEAPNTSKNIAPGLTFRCFAQSVAASAFPVRTSGLTFRCFAQPVAASAFPARTSGLTFQCFAQPVRTSALTFRCFAQPVGTSVFPVRTSAFAVATSALTLLSLE